MSSTPLVALAEQIAREGHQGQFRRGGEVPYIEHPKAVAARVGPDEHAQVVAWLHDVLEDTSVTQDDLREKGIPEACIEAIILLTKTKGTRYEEYLEKVAASPLAAKVKIADMISNLADQPSDRQLKKYAKGLLRLTQDL